MKKHTRVNDILLGPLERPALKWMAEHAPAWVTPDLCTAVGVFGAVVSLAAYILSNYHPAFFWLASLGFFINWVGDSLDGTLARHRHIERPVFGYYIDHVTDAISQPLFFLGLGLSPYISFHVASLTLVAYLMLSVLVYVRTYVVEEYKISYGKLGPTEVRALAILLNTAMFFFGAQEFGVGTLFAGGRTVSVYDAAVAVVGLLILAFFLTTGIQETIRLHRAGK